MIRLVLLVVVDHRGSWSIFQLGRTGDLTPQHVVVSSSLHPAMALLWQVDQQHLLSNLSKPVSNALDSGDSRMINDQRILEVDNDSAWIFRDVKEIDKVPCRTEKDSSLHVNVFGNTLLSINNHRLDLDVRSHGSTIPRVYEGAKDNPCSNGNCEIHKDSHQCHNEND